MNFDYSQYFEACLLNPIIVSVFFLSALTPAIIQSIKKFKISVNKKEIIKFVFLLSIFILFFIVNVGRLLYGGIYLTFERVSDCKILEGEIQDIKEVDNFLFPIIDSGKAVRFLIQGKECTAISQGDFQIGDYVTIKYLPRSRYVLSIKRLEKDEGRFSVNLPPMPP